MLGLDKYSRLGFRCGLEIHQRLATRSKLFCSCNAQLPEDMSVAEVERRQRAVAGELGRIDPSATFESSRSRKFLYDTYKNTTCLVDIDEEPPHEMNREALEVALQIAASLKAEVPYEFEPMRKEVVDGSDPSSFQRTLLVGQEGHLEINGRKIRIPAIFLEEESSGIEYGDSEVVVYSVDRLGIPLIEIDTDPEIRNPQEAKEVAKRLGLILRLTGRVQRGIGSIRQDVNVSIKEGARVEIKGFQELETMDKIIENEIERQLKLVELRTKLQERHAKVHEPREVSYIFAKTNVKLLKKSIDRGGVVFASRLAGFGGLLGREISPNRRLGSEVSDYAKLAGVGGIMHSDENLASYGFEEAEISMLRQKLGVDAADAFIIVTGPEDICKKAIEFANRRAELATQEVPNETRGVDQKSLSTVFLRPLPGGARMYPETDVRPIPLDVDGYEKIAKKAVDVEATERRLNAEIKNKQLAEQMLWSPYLGSFWEIVKKSGVSGSVVAPILLEKTKGMRRMGVEIDRVESETMIHIFKRYGEGAITKVAIEEILKRVPKTGEDVERLIKTEKLERISRKELEKMVKSLGQKSREEKVREIMSKHRLNVDGDELNSLLK